MYKQLRQLEEINMLDQLVRSGIVSIIIASHKQVYEVYLTELKKERKAQAITNTSIKTNTPERTIYRIIKTMESK
jgi:hypothetical protein